MRVAALLAASLLAAALPSAAQPADFVGRPIAGVRVEVAGRAAEDAGLLEAVETRVGDRLSMQAVRESIDHLVGLGQYADVRVFAAAAGDAVALRWALTPLAYVTRVTFEGDPVLDRAALRALITERLGARVGARRLNDLVDLVRAEYRDRGFVGAVIEPRLEPRAAGEVEAVLRVRPGPRTTIGAATLVGEAPRPAAEVLDALDLEPGRPFDRLAIDARVAAYADSLRAQGYYEAVASAAAVFSEDGATASVTLDVRVGRRVEVAFRGDPLPQGVRDDLVPIRRERSVDQDLLEDATRNIETHLRGQGYRLASATYGTETRHGSLVITFTVTRGPLHRVGAVTVEGVEQLTPADLKPLLRVEPGEPFVAARVAAVASALTELYLVRGYTEAAVTVATDVLPEETRGGEVVRPVDVRFSVAEGRRTTVGTVTIEGAEAVAADQIRAALALVAGQPFYRPRLAADRNAVERVYRDAGFQRASVQPQLVPSDDRRHVDIRWRVVEGPRTFVDHILVTGNRSTSADLIRREILFKPGDPLGETALVESQQRLSALGLFRRVRITELPHGVTGNRDVIIDVEEAPATTISYGGGVEVGRRLRRAGDTRTAEERVDIAPRAFFEAGRRNLWGKNRSLNLATRVSFRPRDPAVANPDPDDMGGYGFNEYRMVGIYREPRPFGTPGDAQVTAFVEQAIRSSFNFRRRGVQAEYARRFPNALTLSGRYALNRTRLFDEQIDPEDQLLIDRLFPQVRLSVITGSLLRDSRDDVLDPTRGAVVGIDGSVAARGFGSEVGFARTFLQGAIYRRLPGHGFVVAASARMGLAVGFPREVARVDGEGRPVTGADGQPAVDVVEDVPASERFFAGGDTTVRGFALDRLGTDETLNADGFPTGGNGLVVLNLELRAPYWKGLGLVGFVDAGNVFKRAGDVNLGALRGAAGGGVRYRSPLGPLRVDLGYKLDRRTLRDGSRERGYVVHISLGQAF
ncbi:MAG: POTRA domain-containing protein [Acidobacteriota bacterium]